MRSEWNAKWVAVVLFLAGLVLSGLAGLWQLHRNSATAQAQFGVIADGVVAQIVSRMQTYEYGLRGTRGAALAVGVADIGVERFRRFGESRDIDREFPGARGLGFIRRVTPENEADFLAAARRERGAAFTIRQFRPREGERYVIQYIEPELRNAAAVGLDIASQSHLRLAADAAAASGNATLSSVVTLVQTSGEPMRSLLLLLPVYRPAAPQATSKARQAATLGWTYAPLEISEMLKTFYARDQEFALLLYDVGGGSAPERLFASAAADAPAAGGLFKRVRLPLYGRQWEFELRARPAFVERLNLGGLGPVLAGGLLISALMAAGLYAYLLNAPGAKRLRASQARWSAIAERAHDAIIGHTPEGVVTDWNGGAECLFGVPAQDAIGQALPSLIWPAEAPTSDADTTARVARGEAAPPYDATCQRRDGSRVHVSISASPIKDQNGSITGVAKILRNIDDHQRAKQRLLEANAALENTVLERTALLESAQRDLQHAQTEAQSLLASARHDLAAQQQRLDVVLHGTQVGMWDWNVQTGQTHYDERWADLIGYTLEELAPLSIDTWATRVHPDDLERVNELLQQHFDGALDDFECEMRVRHKLGHWMWALARGRLSSRTPDGEPQWVSGTQLDITSRKLIEEQLREAQLALAQARQRVETPAAAAAGWPAVDGIDMHHAALRLGNDFALFLQMLGRFLDEFGDCAKPAPVPAGSAGRTILAARMHRLRGAAEMLGVSGVPPLAGDIEKVLRSGVAHDLNPVLADLAVHLQRLRLTWSALTVRSHGGAKTRGDAPRPQLDVHAVQQLMIQLKQDSLTAIEQFEALAPSLQTAMGGKHYNELREAMQNLRFQEAAQLLGSIQAS